MTKRVSIAVLFVCALVLAARATRDAKLKVSILDAATGRPTPARVRLLTASGEPVKAEPTGAVGVLWGRNDRADGFLFQPDGSFYADGGFEIDLPAGSYELAVSKGYEYLRQAQSIELKAGKTVAHETRLERWIDMPSRGWYSSDDHIHLQRSPRDNPAVLRWIAAEDIHVGNILEMGDFWTTYFTQYAFGEKGRYREGDYLVSSGQEEPRTPEIGHTISLGAEKLVRFPSDYYSYGRVFDRVHELGGVSGFAHQGETFHGYRGMVLTVLQNQVDFVELAQFCAAGGPIVTEHYYRFLDLGFRLTALAGSDFPWCGRGGGGSSPRVSWIGDARFYTYTGPEFSFEKWIAALKAGHTFVTTGPILELTVNGKLPGSTIDVKPGERVRIEARAFGHAEQIPLDKLEVLVHGEAVRRASGSKSALALEFELPVEHGVWIAARCQAGPTQQAHTTPVYVTVNGGGFYNPKTARVNLKLAENHLNELARVLQNPGNRNNDQASRHEASLEEQIRAARAKLRQLALQFGD